ncbi:MAG: hypothetical protein GVY29_08700 [Spirochaetes bacterium]|jgi:predicted outer membrane repeat protein|nr:hypothetical protein [Spirochaetota bacterium]
MRHITAVLLVATLSAAFMGCSLLGEDNIASDSSAPTTAPALPSFAPAPGTFTSGTEVSILHENQDATIHYTTDGSAATVSSPAYDQPISVAGNGTSLTIRAIAVVGASASEELAGTFTVDYNATAAPSISPGSGDYLAEAEVSITSDTSGATIYYTVDDTAATTSATEYAGPFTITETATIRAVASAAGMAVSEEASATITITPATLVRAQGANDPSPGAPIPDNDPGSLRDVVANAAAGDIIGFATDFYDDGDSQTPLAPISVYLTIQGGVVYEGIVVTQDVTIDGRGRTVELDAAPTGPLTGARLFTVRNGATLTLANLTLMNGDPLESGGAISVESGSGLALENVTVLDSVAFDPNQNPANGGAILANGADVEITGGRFENNVASRGGAINATDTVLKINGTEFVNNNASDFAGGAIRLTGTGSTGTFENAHFEANMANRWGGAVAIVGGADGAVRGSTFIENETGAGAQDTTAGGGALYIGGGQAPNIPTVTVTTSRFIRNVSEDIGGAQMYALRGGAILSDGRLTHVSASEFYGNRSNGGGSAIAVRQGGEGLFAVSSSVFVGNHITPPAFGSFSGPGAIATNAAGNAVNASSFAANDGDAFEENILFENPSDVANLVQNSAFDTAGMNFSNVGTLEYSIAPESLNLPDDLSQGRIRNDNIQAAPGFSTSPSDGGDGYGDDNDDYGDLRLAPGSPAIDAANAAFLEQDSADMDDDGDTVEKEPWDAAGDDRTQGANMDMGAYES